MRPPPYEPRRRKELAEELIGRARTWLADWHPRDDGDFATALFKIAARLESEVTQRLDQVPVRAFRSFLDWLGMKGRPGLAAKLPIVFTMTPGSEPADAPARAQLQATAGEEPVNFETVAALRVLPGSLASLVAVAPERDAFFLPAPGVLSLAAPGPVPDAWTLKADAPALSTTLQLDPPIGLEPGLTLRDAASGQDYRILDAAGGLVTVEPPIGTIEIAPGADAVAPSGLARGTVLTRVAVFAPFRSGERNRQEHALYIGSERALNVETAASIAIENGAGIPADRWYYSGKRTANGPVEWVEIPSPTRNDSRVVLTKPKGAIEAFKVDGHQSRWLKATLAPGSGAASSQVEGLRLTINCDLGDEKNPVEALEGVANTTPLVLDAGFYPLGREPRQFDAFYLGSKEALSKPQANVELDFRLGESVSSAWAAVGVSDASAFVFGIGDDGRLQHQEQTLSTAAGVATPSVIFRSPTQPTGIGQRPVALTGGVRPGAALLSGVPHVTAAAGPEVWLWRRMPSGETWSLLGVPLTKPDGLRPPVSGTMLTRRGVSLVAYAISDGRLFVRTIDGGPDVAWTEALALEDETIQIVAPVVRIDRLDGHQDEADGVVVVTDQKAMLVGPSGGWTPVVAGPEEVDPTFYPLVVRTAGGSRQCVTRDIAGRPRAFDLDLRGTGDSLELELKGHALGFRAIADRIVALMLAVDGSKPAALYAWDAFQGAAHVPAVEGPATGRRFLEGPLHVLTSGVVRYYFFAGEGGEAVIFPIGETAFVERAKLTDGVVLDGDAENWGAKTHLIVDLTPTAKEKTVAVVKGAFRGTPAQRWLLQLTESFDPRPGSIPVRIHEALHGDARAGSVRAAKELRLKDNDNDAAADKFLVVSASGQQRIVEIKSVTPTGATRTVELEQDVPWNVGTAIKYRVLEAGVDRASARLRPVADVSRLDAALVASLRSGLLEFPGLDPELQTPLDVLVAERLAVLDAPWAEAPTGATHQFIARIGLFDAAPYTFEPAKPRNPKLSWEYFDGSAWRLVPNLTDTTEELAKSGKVTFCVPKDLQPTDVAGRKNHWVRARLVGGDYGQESVTLTTVPGSVAGSTVQTVTRSTDSIRAPFVARLTVRYELCCAVVPDVVLARDNGGLVDLTGVNTARGAVVTFFVPLREALAGAAGGDALASPSDRALYLGFDTPLVGGPITVLFLVDEGAHDEAVPLRVDALTGNRFKPVVARDNTRGLNESGTLEITLAESPQLTSLFGRPHYWLRVRPGTRLSDPTTWEPRIRGAYLNATWAEAAETQELEPLGSSDGSPAQRFAVTRPPVLENTLWLRVLERLGDEDVARLRAQGVGVQETLPNVPKRPGCWVLWTQVTDPADAGPADRVYGLDDADGTITFGDGQHGMIPPIGTNNIVAERYQTGGGERANAIKPWTALNLVTPIAGVNATIAPEGAAGGADPQDADTTLRFAPANVKLRDRALTLADLETLALQFSRDIAQAKAVRTAEGVRLLVAMRGPHPIPGAAVRRALDAYLKAHASPALASGDALKVADPDIVEVRVELRLVIDAIEWSGTVARDVGRRMRELLDPATGGRDQRGWPFGAWPGDSEIAATLDGVAHLEGIDRVTVARTRGGPPSALTPLQLVTLAPDGVVVDMVLEEALV